MKFLIVNADDFGFSQEINEGVCQAHQTGVVTDASLLVHSPHAQHALWLANKANLPVGLHIDYFTPFAHLKAPEFGPQSRLLRELFNRESNMEVKDVFSSAELLRIQDEMCRQIEDFRKMAGRLPSHLDYHFGLHYLPEVMTIYLFVAEQYRLPVRWGAQWFRFGEAKALRARNLAFTYTRVYSHPSYRMGKPNCLVLTRRNDWIDFR